MNVLVVMAGKLVKVTVGVEENVISEVVFVFQYKYL